MTGNRVFLYFRNTTELSDWPKASVSKWPNSPEGVKMTDGVGLLVGAKVFIEDDGNPATLDTIPLKLLWIFLPQTTTYFITCRQAIGKKWM